jgi:hypothetical protein
MKKLTLKIFALILAISFVIPSVYISAPPQKVYAVDVPAPTVGDLAATGVTVAACSLGGWVQGLLSSVLPWLAPPKTAGDVTLNTGFNALTAGPSPVPPHLAPTPVVVEGFAGAGAIAGTTVHVPVSDVWLQQQNFQLSQQLAMIQRNTQAVSESSVTSTVHQGNLTFKECVLDPLVFMFKEIIIDAVTDSIVAWIEGGFYGAPSFVEDPGKFFTDVADESVSAFLYESGLDTLLCEPFRLDLILDLSWDFYMPDMDPKYGRLSCSLDEIFPGVDVAIGIDTNGNTIYAKGYESNEAYDQITRKGNIDFPGGGFPAVMGMLRDSNNEIGAKFEAQSSASQFSSMQVSRESTLLQYGKGWFSPRCKTPGKPDTEPDSVCTPGEWVSEQVNDWSGGQLAQLELADEFAEILNALLKLMVETILSEGNTLLTYRR